uniref:Uncharacterized protein n=1 Tax=Chlamydomonas euryale TaxID=1486919 RepID=A0A7R9VMB4_9CHLO
MSSALRGTTRCRTRTSGALLPSRSLRPAYATRSLAAAGLLSHVAGYAAATSVTAAAAARPPPLTAPRRRAVALSKALSVSRSVIVARGASPGAQPSPGDDDETHVGPTGDVDAETSTSSSGSLGDPQDNEHAWHPRVAQEHVASAAAQPEPATPSGLRRQAPAGSEWGEGFLQFRAAGEDERLDVDTLNERLRHVGAARLRHVQSPDEAFGMIFTLDGVVCDARRALVDAAAQMAQQLGVPPLAQHQATALALRTASMPRLLIDVLGWAADQRTAERLSFELSERYSQQLLTLRAAPGLREWVGSLSKFNVPCAVVTSLDRRTAQALLQRLCLHDFFEAMVTGDEEFETVSQRLLSASMALKRPPNHCVVFGDSPQDITAAHNCTMKAVAVCSARPAYSLKNADLTVGNLSELTVYNMRRLFAGQGTDLMDLHKERDQDSSGRNKRKNRVRLEML